MDFHPSAFFNKDSIKIRDNGVPDDKRSEALGCYCAWIFIPMMSASGGARRERTDIQKPTKHIGKMLNKVTNKFFNSFLFYGIISSINKNL